MRRLIFLLVIWVLVLQQAAAQWYAPEDFARRRSKVMEKVPDGIAVLFGAEMPDGFVRFRQNNNFYYLTGVELPDAILLLNPAEKESYLFVPDRVSDDIKMEAIVTAGEEGKKKTGIEHVLLRGRFTNVLSSLLNRKNVLYTPFSPEELVATPSYKAARNNEKRLNDPWDGRLSREVTFMNHVRQRFPAATIKDLQPYLTEMRWVKDEKEIAVLKRCVEIGVKGIVESIKATRPGMFQYELEAICNYTFQREGAMFPAYYAIVASGEDGLIGHYNANNHKMKQGEVVLVDYAPEFEYMTCDLNRSWPVGGEFTPDQRKMYDCVLETSKEIIKAIKPGVKISDLSEIGRRVFEKHGFGDRFRPGVGHFVGMAVHDVGFRDRPFVPGVVFNVEPILEDKEKKIHIRIEDTILVTKDGAEHLSRTMPWEVEDLYNLMQGH